MGDESRRNKERDIRLSETQMRQPGMEDIVRPEASSSSGGQASDLEEEYHYVLADLQRIGVIAVVMLGVLVGLAFFLA